MKTLAIVLAGALGVAAATSDAAGQRTDRPEDVHLRNDCRLAAQVLQTGHPAPKATWAMEMIANCSVEGPPTLAQLWSSATLDSARAEQVLNASSRLRDKRIADAALHVAQTTTNPDAVRLAAVILLVRYVDPHTGLAVPLLVQPAGWTPERPVRSIPLGLSPHEIPQVRGPAPLPSEFVETTFAVLRQLGASDPNWRVRWAAAGIMKSLENRRAGGYLSFQP